MWLSTLSHLSQIYIVNITQYHLHVWFELHLQWLCINFWTVSKFDGFVMKRNIILFNTFVSKVTAENTLKKDKDSTEIPLGTISMWLFLLPSDANFSVLFSVTNFRADYTAILINAVPSKNAVSANIEHRRYFHYASYFWSIHHCGIRLFVHCTYVWYGRYCL